MSKSASRFNQHGKMLSSGVYHLEPRNSIYERAHQSKDGDGRKSDSPPSKLTGKVTKKAKLLLAEKVATFPKLCRKFLGAAPFERTDEAAKLLKEWRTVTALAEKFGDAQCLKQLEKSQPIVERAFAVVGPRKTTSPLMIGQLSKSASRFNQHGWMLSAGVDHSEPKPLVRGKAYANEVPPRPKVDGRKRQKAVESVAVDCGELFKRKLEKLDELAAEFRAIEPVWKEEVARRLIAAWKTAYTMAEKTADDSLLDLLATSLPMAQEAARLVDRIDRSPSE